MYHRPVSANKDSTPRSLNDQDLLARFRAYRQTRDLAVRDALVCAHLHLVHSVARRFSGLGESLDDMIQEGTIGLLNAVDLYDPDRGIKFSTYACHLITGQIQHYLRDRGRLIRQPAWVQELSTKITKAAEGLAQELGRTPTAAEIALRLNLPEDSVQSAMAARELVHVASLTAPSDTAMDGEPTAYEKEKSTDNPRAGMPLPIEDRIVLDEAINNLKALEQQVVRLFFFGDLTQSEIARKLGISVNYASYLLRRATTKIKAALDEPAAPAAPAPEENAMAISAPIPAPIHDPITGLYSGVYLRTRMTEEVARSERYPTNFALMLVAVQGLGEVPEVQPVLMGLAQVLRSSARNVDLIAYMGTGRFALLLPHTGREARVLGERLCAQFATLPLAHSVLSLHVGFAVFPNDGESADTLLARAERTLASAIKAGPNTVSSITPPRPLRQEA